MAILSSTYSLLISSQSMMRTLQKDLGERQRELSTGRKSELTIDLGSQLRQCFNRHSLSSSLDTYLSNNQIVLTRLETTQSILSEIALNAEEFKSSLILSRHDPDSQKIITSQAGNLLNSLISSLNTSIGNTYVFGGDKSNVQPLNPYYSSSLSPAKSAIDAAYVADPPDGFGFTQTSSQVSFITPDQMNDFINGPYSDIFSETEWMTKWSMASNEPLNNKISPYLLIETSITANDSALRKFAMAYVMMSDLGSGGMNDKTHEILTSKAATLLDEGIRLLNATRARVGVMQEEINGAAKIMLTQKDMLKIQFERLESADQTDVAISINNLLSRIETSYTLTARLSRLSLTNYL